jgi:hypothetical protein
VLAVASSTGCVFPTDEPTGVELSWKFVEVNQADGEEATRVLTCAGALAEDIAARVVDVDDPRGRQGTFRFDCEDGFQTENDSEVTEKITSAFRSHFGPETVYNLGRVTASEDFSHVPNALGTPYTYWGVGCSDPEKYEQALKAGRVEQDIPVNHSEFFAPVIEPTLSTGTQALVVAALTYLAK